MGADRIVANVFSVEEIAKALHEAHHPASIFPWSLYRDAKGKDDSYRTKRLKEAQAIHNMIYGR